MGCLALKCSRRTQTRRRISGDVGGRESDRERDDAGLTKRKSQCERRMSFCSISFSIYTLRFKS